ncbi:MAG: hypothetical protein Ct9H300mP16_18870 [Pseudomonadota bacterium]|nr:MAG: hypothetical protein Ct9H300mP16_18870 [Pseudomonadota bacterium]
MTHNTVSYESRNRVAIITINRPEKMNAISPAVGEALRSALQRLNDSDDGAGIITGAGERAFSAGADLDDSTEMYPFIPGVGIRSTNRLWLRSRGPCIGARGARSVLRPCREGPRSLVQLSEAKIFFPGGLITSLAARIPHKIPRETDSGRDR